MGVLNIKADPKTTFTETFSDDELSVLKVIDTESAAYFANDFETLAAQWVQTEQAMRIFAGPRVGVRKHQGWSQIGEGFQNSMQWAPQNYDAREYLVRKNTQISISGDIAWVYYDQVLAKNDPAFITEPLHHETKILLRIEGQWRIVSMILVVPESRSGKTPEIRLDEQGCVVAQNDEAKARLSQFQGLKIVGDRLHARNRELDAGFQAEIENRVAFLKTMFAPGLVNRSAQPIQLGEDDYSRPLYCWIRVVQSEISVTFDDASALEGWIANASQLFALSPSQERLVSLLLSGLDLRGIAEKMGVKLSTVRTQLRRIFEKTGTNSQTALATCLLSVRKLG